MLAMEVPGKHGVEVVGGAHHRQAFEHMAQPQASLGIGREVRAQLQSHGLGGVQDRHYDDHDYMPEKRAALLDLLNTVPADNVTPIHLRGAA